MRQIWGLLHLSSNSGLQGPRSLLDPLGIAVSLLVLKPDLFPNCYFRINVCPKRVLKLKLSKFGYDTPLIFCTSLSGTYNYEEQLSDLWL